jgi:membrane protease YdiL (CAAX protease family)
MPQEDVPESVFEDIEPGVLEEIGDPVTVTFAASVIYIPIFLISAALCIFWQKTIPGPSFSASRVLEDLGIGCAVGLALVGLTVFLARYLRPLRTLEVEFKSVLGPLDRKTIVYLAVLSGLTEEFCFRGWMQPLLGYVFTSILFGCLHFVPSKRFLPWTFFALVVGFVFGGLMEWRESLVAPIAAHMLVNGINLYLIVSGKRLRPLSATEEAPLSHPPERF